MKRWSVAEKEILRETYPTGGLPAAAAQLSGRSSQAIYVMASKLGLRTDHRADAPTARLRGKDLIDAMEMRTAGETYAAIGAAFGLSEAAAMNAVIAETGARRGFKPLIRLGNGQLHPASIETIRTMLRKGMKPRDIQERCGVSASCVAEQRRRYRTDLKQRRKAPLPPPGAGERYSGARIDRPTKSEVERLLMEGRGSSVISRQTGVSSSTVKRLRTALVKRLRRKGECLTGCDIDGRRVRQSASVRSIPSEDIARLRELIESGTPVRRAAKLCAIGASSAYRIRDELRAQLEADGRSLKSPVLPGRVSAAHHPSRMAAWLPDGRAQIYRYRALCAAHGPETARSMIEIEAEAERARIASAARAEALRPKTFEEQLALVRSGKARVIEKIPMPTRALPDMTLGGVATGQLA